ncbi:hypothetical protein HPB52_021954 [Rhipicephalus sanguineus]|uniref:Uncharacterized protein n=1 Tax=Rhipicephalus sanguineus TaxID=34632 RepID=A0A9D4T2S0_RHISA|nr:hypothetical protein HPB52_021954 [Rhipicephalus sanguineus]
MRRITSALGKYSRKVLGAARSLLARGRGCTPALALRIYNAVASAKALYGLPLISLSALQWSALDTDHRNAVRELYGLPHNSQVGPALAEAGDMPLSLRATQRALNHVLRLNNTAQGQRLVERLATLSHSCMGRRVSELRTIVPDTPPYRWPVTPPHRHTPLDVHTHIPRIKAKARTPIAAMQQECAALVSDQLCGRLLVYADGSGLPIGATRRKRRCSVCGAISRRDSEVPPPVHRLVYGG